MSKKFLGLDLGTNSIGWALIEIDHEKKIVKILGLGSRILTMDAAEIANFESGTKIASTAAQRTEKRSPRKLNERYLLRRDRLHCVLNLLNSLPQHYKLSIEFENEKGKRSGKFKKGVEEKLAYYKDENGKSQFLFKDAYYQMEREFKKLHPEMFYNKNNGSQTQIPYDWTLYYLRHKAVTNREFELTKEQLAWITLSFNQKRGYEKVIGQDEKIQKEGELTDTFVGKVKSVNKIEGKNIYEIILVDNNNETSELFRYKEETKIPITEIGDLKEVEIITKYDENSNKIDGKTIFRIKEVKCLKIIDVKFTDKKNEVQFFLNTGWNFKENRKFLPKLRNENQDFIIETDYNNNGIQIPKNAGNKGKVDVKIEAPDKEDWTLMKLKTETSLTSFNSKNNTKGVASFVYYNLLQNPKQKIKGDLITVIERDYYREELDAIYKNQEKFHSELRKENRALYEQAIQLLYPNNSNHQKTIKGLDFNYLIKDDILLYQRDLKSKKSLIADCVYEKENFERTNEKTGKKYKKPLKAIHKFNPLYQEFRLWQFIKRLKVIKKEDVINEEIKINIDVTAQLLTNKIREELYEVLNDKESVTEKDILTFLNKKYKDLSISADNYKWNFTSEKEPCNPTRYKFILLTKRVLGSNYKSFLTPENEYSLWHFFYSVKKKDEFNKGLNNIIGRLLEKSNLSKEYQAELVKSFSSFGGYPNDYGTYSEKAIKKLLPFLRLGKYWNAKNIEAILSKVTHEIKQKVLDKEEINGEVEDFQGLWISSACYLAYGRYSEVGEVQFWQSPYDIENYLKNEFRQHSLNNPTVEKILVETLHVVKDIWKYFGEKIGTDEEGRIVYQKLFNEIHIELGREMKKNNKQKERDDKLNKENRKSNDRIVELLRELKRSNTFLQEKSPFQQEKLRIVEETLLSSIEYDKDNTEYKLANGKITKKEIKEITTKEFSKISRGDLERYKLWLDQRYQSPYTGRFIKLSDLFDSNKYRRDHIFPQERITLNSLSNLVMCETEINDLKSARTGYGFIQQYQGKEIKCAAHENEPVGVINIQQYEELVNGSFSGKKREILLSKEIPSEFTNSQLNNSQYISKMAMKLLSNIVREKDEDTFRSKNVLATNGTITTTLKRHWQLNDAWNEIISPRFKRLNELTNSNLFGDYRKINGHQVFINEVPEEANKNFNSKRIDHRHHALDALVIALTTENHVNYLNNISSQENSEEKLKTRKGIKFQLTNSKKGFNDEKEWYFLQPAQIKTREGIEEYEYQFKDVKSKVFKEIAQNALENTIASFKQKNRVIRQRWNKYLNNENGNIIISKEDALTTKQKYNVRQALHDATFYGQTNLYYETTTMPIEKAIKENFTIVDFNIRTELDNLTKSNSPISEIISTLYLKYKDVQVYNKFIASRYNGELEKFSSIPSNRIEEKIKSITDTAIQKILLNHINNYIEIDEKGNDFYNTERAFSSDGIIEMNNNIQSLNEGKLHQKIYKVRIGGKMGKAFTVSENGFKNSKIVKTAGDSNFYCGFYENGGNRKFYIPTLRESVESLKEGFEPCPSTHPKESDFKLLFVLNPSDLVYIPTNEENENPNLVDFNNLKKEQVNRIYKFTDGSENSEGGFVINFIPSNISSLIYGFPKKDAKKKANEIKQKYNLDYDGILQNEIGKGSPQSKNQNSIDGIQIKSVCWKLKSDRLGNLSKV